MTTTRIEFSIGTSIHEAAEMLVKACKTAEKAQGYLEGIEIVAYKTTKIEDIVAQWMTQSERRAQAWREPRAGWETVASVEKRLKMQCAHDAAMRLLPSLDFNNLAEILGWLKEIQPSTNFEGVNNTQPELVLDTFKLHGYMPTSTGEGLKTGEREQYARDIIGRALYGLVPRISLLGLVAPRAIHPAICKWVDDWNTKFPMKPFASN